MYFDLLVVPVPDAEGAFPGCSIILTDVTRAHRLQGEVERTQQELQLETTNEELQSTRLPAPSLPIRMGVTHAA